MWSPYWDSWTDDILKKMPKDQQGVTPHFVEAFHTYIKTHRRWDDRKKKLGQQNLHAVQQKEADIIFEVEENWKAISETAGLKEVVTWWAAHFTGIWFSPYDLARRAVRPASGRGDGEAGGGERRR